MDPTGLGVQQKPGSTEDSELELHCKLGPFLRQGHWLLCHCVHQSMAVDCQGGAGVGGPGYSLAWGLGLPFW